MSKLDELRCAIAADRDLDPVLESWREDIHGIAAQEARRAGLERAEERDEARSLAWEVVAQMVAEERLGVARAAYRFEAHLVMRLRNRVRQWRDSQSGRAPASQMSSMLRRRRAILALMSQGLSVGDAVETLNSSCRKRDGAYRVEDVEVPLAVAPIERVSSWYAAPLNADEVSALMMGPEAGYVVAPFEGRAFVEEVTRRVRASSPREARIVHEWLRTAWEGDEPATTAALADRLGVSRSAVGVAVARGRRVAADLLSQMGVHP